VLRGGEGGSKPLSAEVNNIFTAVNNVFTAVCSVLMDKLFFFCLQRLFLINQMIHIPRLVALVRVVRLVSPWLCPRLPRAQLLRHLSKHRTFSET
jgi:hypothetical protein